MNAIRAGPPTEKDLAQRRFAAAVAHELRTPLAGLRAEIEEARLHPGETDLPRLLDAVLRGVARLEAITADLFVLTQVADGGHVRRRPIDLSALARAHAATPDTGPQIRLRAADEVIVDAVPTLLDRLVTNLLDNALRYAKCSIQIQVRRHGATAELIVTDDGPGIPAADRERVFESFARLDSARCRRRGGAGLGLAIARDIAHAHDGTLHVESVTRGGARFVLRLPATRHADGQS
ncbi:sensor histidine kinase [Nonomuraea purpurea]|uniref:histidine kinase n=1 Tax=Nonomuraea purpurea TaxID=1849276 RepID=A0ABV8FXE7_9ACTN